MRLFFEFSIFLIISTIISCKKNPSSENNSEFDLNKPQYSTYNEKFRPQFHFSPPANWMNDPNGLVYQNGVYHLFYQYYPDDIVWGPMHWGHAISKNLIEWENKPIALFPDKQGFIFSGSAVVDKNNTSGFGTKDNPPLVAIFTYHSEEKLKLGKNNHQTQGIAYSLDNGNTWAKYGKNPVIDNQGIMDFRDPKVFWYESLGVWVMVLVAGDHVKFYQSENLKSWDLKGDFGKEQGAHGGVWECPDLFKLPVENGDTEKWVLLVSVNPGGPNEGSATQYFIGDFDGSIFKASHTDTKWLDYGMDNYAGITYNNLPNDERIFIGWMSNWLYAQKAPTEVWRSAMTLPRALSLFSKNDDFYLRNYPIQSFDSLTNRIEKKDSISLKTDIKFENPNFNASDIHFKAFLNDDLQMVFSNDIGENFKFMIDPELSQMIVDRRESGITNFEEHFAKSQQTQPFWPEDKLVEIRIILDASSVEIFVDKGQYVFTNTIFPNKPYTNLKISSKTGKYIQNFNINQINSIWNHE